MNNAKTYLLVGGPCDGRRINLAEGDTIAVGPLAVHVTAPVFEYEESPPPIVPEPMREIYMPVHVRCEKIEIDFFRHEDLTFDDAMVRLFDRYPQEEAPNG